MADDTKSRKQAFRERLQGRHPDANLDDEEEMYGAIGDDYDDYDQQIAGYQDREKGYQDREQGLVDMFEKDPRSANFLTSWRNGADPAVELMRLFGPELREALDDPDKQDELAKAHQEAMDRIEKEKVSNKEYDDNFANSMETIAQAQQDMGLSDDDVQTAMDQVIGIVRDAIRGVYTPETVQLFFKGLNHDSDVAQASEEGRVAGRNSRITESLRKPKGDGVPSVAGSSQAPQGGGGKNDIFSLARNA